MNIAYLRVSTSKQHLENQREEIARFARRKGLSIDRWYNDVISGKIRYRERKLGDILKKLKAGDVLIVTEVSRLSRTLIEIMNIINTCVERKVILHSTKEGYTFGDDLNSKILGFAFGLVAEIERNLISIRTREALAVRQACGMKLGRPFGTCPKPTVLTENRDEVFNMLKTGATWQSIADTYQTSVSTVYRFLKAQQTE